MSRHRTLSRSTIGSTQPPQNTSIRPTLMPFSIPEPLLQDVATLEGEVNVRGPLTHDPRVPSVASQHNFIVQPLITKEWNARAF